MADTSKTPIDKGELLAELVLQYLTSPRGKSFDPDSSDSGYDGKEAVYNDFIGWIYETYLYI